MSRILKFLISILLFFLSKYLHKSVNNHKYYGYYNYKRLMSIELEVFIPRTLKLNEFILI